MKVEKITTVCKICEKSITVKIEEYPICPECSKEMDKYHEDLIKFLIKAKIFDQKDKIYDVPTKREDQKLEMEMVLYLLSSYNEKCLISTIIDVDNLYEDFEESYTKEDRENYPDELNEYIFNAWKAKGTISNEEDTKDFIGIFTSLIACYGVMGLISRIIEIMNLCEEFDDINDK